MMPGQTRAFTVVLRQRHVDVELVAVARTRHPDPLANRAGHLGREVDVLRQFASPRRVATSRRYESGTIVGDCLLDDDFLIVVVDRRDDGLVDVRLALEQRASWRPSRCPLGRRSCAAPRSPNRGSSCVPSRYTLLPSVETRTTGTPFGAARRLQHAGVRVERRVRRAAAAAALRHRRRPRPPARSRSSRPSRSRSASSDRRASRRRDHCPGSRTASCRPG